MQLEVSAADTGSSSSSGSAPNSVGSSGGGGVSSSGGGKATIYTATPGASLAASLPVLGSKGVTLLGLHAAAHWEEAEQSCARLTSILEEWKGEGQEPGEAIAVGVALNAAAAYRLALVRFMIGLSRITDYIRRRIIIITQIVALRTIKEAFAIVLIMLNAWSIVFPIKFPHVYLNPYMLLMHYVCCI
jgi:hypothetical protein